MSARRILIVEDDHDLQPLISRAVEAIDPEIKIDWVSSVRPAFGCLEANAYELILADYLLRGSWNGLFLRHLCQRKYPATPFLLMSSITPEECEELVGDDEVMFLAKPFTVQECRDLLMTQLLPVSPGS